MMRELGSCDSVDGGRKGLCGFPDETERECIGFPLPLPEWGNCSSSPQGVRRWGGNNEDVFVVGDEAATAT